MLRSRASQRGFTLVEILVVVVIITVLSGLVMLSVGDGGRERELDRETRRLAAVIRLASEEAVLQSRELGLRVERDGYGFYRLEGDAWQPVEDVRQLTRHDMPEHFRLTADVEGLDAGLTEDSDDGELDDPQILVLSSGELTPFEIRLRMATGGPDERTATIRGELTGEVETSMDADE